MKESMYKTFHKTKKIKSIESRHIAKKLLSSVKSIIHKEKFNIGKTYVAGKGNLNKAAIQNKSQLATYKSQKQIADLKRNKKELLHEEMLKEELRKFRIEIETKFRASKVNNTYRFPNTRNESNINNCIDCIFIHYT